MLALTGLRRRVHEVFANLEHLTQHMAKAKTWPREFLPLWSLWKIAWKSLSRFQSPRQHERGISQELTAGALSSNDF